MRKNVSRVLEIYTVIKSSIASRALKQNLDPGYECFSSDNCRSLLANCWIQACIFCV